MIITEMFGDAGRPTLLISVDHDYTTPGSAWIRLNVGDTRVNLQFSRFQMINLDHQIRQWLDRPRPPTPLHPGEPIMQPPEPEPIAGDPFSVAAKPKPKPKRRTRR